MATVAVLVAVGLLLEPQARSATLSAPSIDHPLGTDLVGYDYLRVTLYGLATTLIEAILGCALGVLLAMFSSVGAAVTTSRISSASRGAVIAVTAAPPLLTALVFVRLIEPARLVVALGFVSWPRMFRVFDATAQSARASDEYEMARSVGLARSTLVGRYLIAPMLRSARPIVPLELMELVALHATLSFLGVGSVDSSRSIGRLAASGRHFLETSPWLFWGPAVALVVTLLVLLQASALTLRPRSAHAVW